MYESVIRYWVCACPPGSSVQYSNMKSGFHCVSKCDMHVFTSRDKGVIVLLLTTPALSMG